MRLSTELFIVPDQDGYMVFAPLKRMVFQTDTSVATMLAALSRGNENAVDSRHHAIKTLVACGIIDGPDDDTPKLLPPDRYKPTHLTLFLTSRCNLGCIYCYGSANSKSIEMPEEMGRAAIDLVAQNCIEQGVPNLSVGFHGGGEPTMAWLQLKALTIYAQEVAERCNLKPNIGMSSNGCFGPERAKWIAQNMNFVSLSIDGPPSIQDRLRPFANGKPSSSAIRAAVRVFDAAQFPYSIQSTFTRETADRMPEAVRYFARYMRPRFLKFEPVSDAGRFASHPEFIPSMREFADSFNRAYEIACARNIKLSFSGIRLWGSSVTYFCGAFLEPFNVTPDGYVTACYEVCAKDTPFSDVFIFGRYDAETRKFPIDMQQLGRLRSRNVYNLEPCSRCFCKYSCAGDCAARNFRNYGQADLGLVGARCEAVREITRFRLRRYIETAQSEAKRRREEAKVHGTP